MTTRRSFLVAAAAAAALPGVAPELLPRASGGPPQDAPASRASRRVTAAVLAEAEKVAGVEFTPPERDMMTATVARQRDAARKRPTPAYGPADGPALVFRPRGSLPAPLAASSSEPPAEPAVPLAGPDLAFASIGALGAALRSGRTTAVELAKFFLARLRRLDPVLRAVVNFCDDRALEEAAAADRELAAGKDRGPLHGIPYGVKDLFDTAGIVTTWGALPFKDRRPAADAGVVRLLRDAGAVLVAKLSLGELAMGDEWFGGRTNNPWRPAEGSSGSSAGSCAAVAAGAVPFAIGTETLGSIVSPSMRCGTTGLRPTFGLVPLDGAMPLCPSLDKAGPIARSVADAWTVLKALVPASSTADGADARRPAVSAACLPDVRGFRIGYVADLFEGRGELKDLERRALDLFRAAGAELIPIQEPDLPYDSLMTILHAEAAASMEEWTADGRDDLLARQTPDAWPNSFRASRFLTAVDFLQADRLRRRVVDAFDVLFAPLDLIVGPSFGGSMLVATNFTGHPCLVVRAGFRKRGGRGSEPEVLTPHGLSLWSKPYDEARLVRGGAVLESGFAAASRRPPID